MPRGQQIRNYVTGVLNDSSMSPMEQTRDIHGKAQEYGVNAQQLAQNSPATMEAINRNLGKAGLTLEGASPYQAANTNTNPQQGQPRQPYGLSGSEKALSEGMAQSRQDIQAIIESLQGSQQGIESALTQGMGQAQQGFESTMEDVEGTFGSGIEGLTPFIEPGQQASQYQAALSGSLGPQEQSQAFTQYQSSPYVQRARENAEKAIRRNASATGTLGSGNTLDQLYQNAAGMFMQDFGNQFQRAGQVADRGMSAASNTGSLASTLGGIQANVGTQGAQVPLEVGSQIAQSRGQTSRNMANLGMEGASLPVQVGQQIASDRIQAGRDIASQTQQATSALASLAQQQGAGTSDIIGQGAQNIQQLFARASQGDAQAKQQLSTTLANLSSQEATQLGNQQIVPGNQTNLMGRFGNAVSGIGGMLEYLPNEGAA